MSAADVEDAVAGDPKRVLVNGNDLRVSNNEALLVICSCWVSMPISLITCTLTEIAEVCRDNQRCAPERPERKLGARADKVHGWPKQRLKEVRILREESSPSSKQKPEIERTSHPYGLEYWDGMREAMYSIMSPVPCPNPTPAASGGKCQKGR